MDDFTYRAYILGVLKDSADDKAWKAYWRGRAVDPRQKIEDIRNAEDTPLSEQETEFLEDIENCLDGGKMMTQVHDDKLHEIWRRTWRTM